MPVATENEHTTPNRPVKLDLAAELLDTFQSHIKAVEKRMESFEKTTDARAASIERTVRNSVIAGFAVFTVVMLIGFGAGTYMVSLIASAKGVDVGGAADATNTVITSTSDAISTTTTALTGSDATTTTTTTTTPGTPGEAPAALEEP